MYRPLLIVALLLLLLSLAIPFAVEQRPDADATALAAFDAAVAARFGEWLPVVSALGLLDLRHTAWPNLAGVLVAFAAIERAGTGVGAIFRRFQLQRNDSGKPYFSIDHAAVLTRGLVAAGLLLALLGWGWDRSRGWWGELFLAPGAEVALGPEGRPTLEFVHFTRPPAAAGPGRALTVELRLDGEPITASAPRPYRANGWTIQPHWYGGIVSIAGSPPLYFGGSGRQIARTNGGEVVVTYDMPRATATVNPVRPIRSSHYLIVQARYAPGRPLSVAGLLIAAVAAAFWWPFSRLPSRAGAHKLLRLSAHNNSRSAGSDREDFSAERGSQL